MSSPKTPTEQDKELDVILAKHNGELGVTLEDPDVVTPDTKQALLDWHNKQVEAVLDKLELNMRGKTVIDTAEGWKEFIRKHVNGAIEAERNKLKEEEL